MRGDEFISKFAKTDKVKPVITLVIYFGDKKWDGAKSLHELWEVEGYPPELLTLATDFFKRV